MTKQKKIKLVIDAGHGGNDNGALATDNTTEKEMALQWALLLKKAAESRGIEVIMTRSTDALPGNAVSKNEGLKNRIKFIPGALVAVIVSIILNEIFIATNNQFIIGPDHLVQIKAASSASEFLSFFTLPDFSGFMNSKVLVTGVMIAIIASLETLLSIEAIDNIDPETVGYGVDNMVGLESPGVPTTRSMGVNLNIKF